MKRTYSDLIQIEDYMDRYEYLKLGGTIGVMTFGSDRYLNQVFYRSPEWRSFRREIIIRDKGCDMAYEGFDVSGGMIVVHHLNPITADDVIRRRDCLFDPENVVAVSELTHKAIHYGDASLLPHIKPIERVPNDMCPWR